MAITASFLANAGLLSIFSDNLNNTVTVSRNAAGNILINGGAVAVLGGTPTVANTSLIQAFGLGGNDNLALDESNGALPASQLFGGAGNDTVVGGSGNDRLFGQGDNDVILGKGGFDLLFGGSGNDTLTGGDADDQVFGEGGDDLMIWNPGDDTDLFEGGAGIDTVQVNGGNGAEVFTISANGARVRFDRIDPAPFSIDIGTSEKLVLNANGGNDLISTSGNLAALIQLTLDGGAGNDTMDGGVGNDTYVIDVATDKITDSGKDTGDTVQTGTAALHIDLTDVGFFAGIENVSFTGKEDLNATGTAVKNVLTGNDGDNVLIGNGDNDTLIGGGGGDTLVGGTGSDSMAGGTGNDVYDVDIAGDKVLENKDAGIDVVRSTINYILGANLEALVLIGTGNLNGTGNELDNAINGTDGNNILDGKQGDDILEGFGGDDTYIVDKIFVDNPDPIPDTGDKVVETEKGGHDTVKSTVTYSIAAFENVEDLTLIGGLHIDGTGNKLDNVLTGNGAFNKLDGGLGADTMKGGAGDDTYAIDDKDDKVDETGGSGLNDTAVFVMTDPLDEQAIADKFAAQLIGGVLTSKLIGGVEHYDFAKFTTDVDLNIAGDNAANRIIATKFADTLTGNGGNDTLDGGLGIDSLTGGLGNDTYVIDTLDDKIVELKNGGTDTIVSLLTDYTLKEPDGLNYNFENLTIGDDAEGGDANGTGNSAANVVRGNAFDNKLFGVGGNDTIFGGTGDDTLDGGIGNDSMVGGFGSDTYILDSKSDKVLEGPNPGINDTVIAPFDYTLGANVENLTITGTAKIATGNTSGNHIIGNDLDNVIDGKGGIDKLEGGKGDDTYIVREIPEAGVTEQADGGNDTIKTSWFDAPMPDNVENLIFTMGYHNTGIGNASDNHIVGHVVSDTLDGNAGDDTLDGGAGADVLTGGKGDDTYIVDNAKDVVVEFPGAPEGIDTIQAKMSIDLAKYENFNLEVIENVTLTGASALIATGNTLDNLLTGNTGANKLLGNAGNDTLNGGQGGDSMVGGADNDTYFVDSAADKVDETGGTGTDTVSSAITFNLTANGTSVKGELENLTLTGTGTINGTGNSFDNIIHGNDKANKLDGGGGADTITGHGGIDQIDVVNGNDTVRFESVLDGHDVIANFDGDAAGGQDTVDLDALFDSLSIAGPDRAGRVSLTPGVGTVDVSVDVSALHDGSNVITFGTLNTIDAITVGQDVLVGA
jgi:Ca2+-binding RTX toxin-like protein